MKIVKIGAIVVLVLALVAACIYSFGSLKLFEPSSVKFSDGKSLKFDTGNEWCGISSLLFKISGNTPPAGTVMVKKHSCKINQIKQPAKVYDFVQIEAKKTSEATDYLKLLEICAAPNPYGVSGFKESGSFYCVSPEKMGIRAVTGFTKLSNGHIVVTSLIVAPEENAKEQTKKLINLVNSYKFD